jgi:hypothetical protein
VAGAVQVRSVDRWTWSGGAGAVRSVDVEPVWCDAIPPIRGGGAGAVRGGGSGG